MEKILNDCILACENCVVKCCSGDKQMNDCIRMCHTQELLCKVLKVAIKNKVGQATLKPLKEANMQNAKKSHEICSKHKDKYCVKCSKQLELLIEGLSK
jgi:hypothetical protein